MVLNEGICRLKLREMGCGLLPNSSNFWPSLLEFLDQTNDDLSKAPELASQLKNECKEIDRSLLDLHTKITERILKWASHSQHIESLLHDLTLRVHSLRSSTDASEHTLQLEALVGDLEDAVSCAMADNSKKFSSRKFLNAINSEGHKRSSW